MRPAIIPRVRVVAALAATACCGYAHASPSEEVAAYGDEAKVVARILAEQHYSRRTADDALSQQWLRRYFELVDPGHRWLLRKDVVKLEKRFGTMLDDALSAGDTAPAGVLYGKLRDRVRERRKWIESFLRDEEPESFSFSTDATAPKVGDSTAWPADRAAADDVWRSTLLAEVLAEKLRTGTSLAVARNRVAARYHRHADQLQNADAEAMFDRYITALAQCYDPHCNYFSTRDLDRFRHSGRPPVGIGALLEIGGAGYCTVAGTLLESPAERAGLQVGDRIVALAQGAVDGPLERDPTFVDLVYLDLAGIVAQIRGRRDSALTLRVIPRAAPDPAYARKVVLRRDLVPVHERRARVAVLEVGKGRVGWLMPRSLYQTMPDDKSAPSASRDLVRLIAHLETDKLAGLVLDLRGNSGGSFQEALNVVSLFVGGRAAMRMRSRADAGDEATETHRGNRKQPLYDGPLVVLVDAQTASIAELVPGMLQDYGRAIIIGDSPTFGKGSVQTIVGLGQHLPNADGEHRPRAGALKFTVAGIYRPSGRSIQFRGVEPDFLLPLESAIPARLESALPNALPADEIAPHSGFGPAAVLKTQARPPRPEPERAQIIEKLRKIRDRRDISLNEQQRRTQLAEIRRLLKALDQLSARRPAATIRKQLSFSGAEEIQETKPAGPEAGDWLGDHAGVDAAIEVLLDLAMRVE